MYEIKKSTLKTKKYDVFKENKKLLSFGATGYDDYTVHNDIERKKRYVIRHKKNENWSDPNTAGFWAKHILWNKSTIDASISDTSKRFGIKISLNV